MPRFNLKGARLWSYTSTVPRRHYFLKPAEVAHFIQFVGIDSVVKLIVRLTCTQYNTLPFTSTGRMSIRQVVYSIQPIILHVQQRLGTAWLQIHLTGKEFSVKQYFWLGKRPPVFVLYCFVQGAPAGCLRFIAQSNRSIRVNLLLGPYENERKPDHSLYTPLVPSKPMSIALRFSMQSALVQNTPTHSKTTPGHSILRASSSHLPAISSPSDSPSSNIR